jgi:hypothetical protein
MAEGELGDVVGDGGDLTRDRVVFHLQRLLDDDAEGRVLDHQIESQERTGFVLIRGGDEQRAVDVFLQERRFDFDRADLRFVRTAGSRGGVDALTGEVCFGAGVEAFGQRRVGGEALREGNDGLLDVGLGEAVGVGQAFVVDVK